MTPGKTGIAIPGTAWRTQAVVLEVDGVLLDTTAARAATWHWWARHVGADPDALATEAAGRRLSDVVTAVLADTGADLDPDAEVARLEERLRLLLRSSDRQRGAAGLLRTVPPDRLAVVSSLSAEHLAAALRRARVRTPTHVISADDVAAGRPDPAGHLAAAALLGREPADCTTLEHAPAGVAAGLAAGMTVVAVTARIDPPELAGADVLVHHPGALQVQFEADGLRLRVTREPKRFA